MLMMFLSLLSNAYAETDISDKVQLVKSRMMYNRTTQQNYLDVSLTNISDDIVVTPIKVVIESISSPDVTVSNADGYTEDGLPYFEYTNAVGGIAPSESLDTKRWMFSNPGRLRFRYNAVVYGVVPDAAGIIGSEGGVVEVTNSESTIKGVRVVVLNNTFPEELLLTVSIQQDISLPPLPNGFIPEGEYISFESNSVQFVRPVAVELPIPDNLEPDELLILFTFDEETGVWREVPPAPSPFGDKMVVFLDHFSTYVQGRVKTTWDSVRTEFAFGEEKDTLKFTNWAGVCRGMAHMASRYWNKWVKNEGEGLYCRWSEVNEEAIVTGLHAEIKDYDYYTEYINIVIGIPELLLLNHDASFNYIKLQSSLNKTVPLTLIDTNLFTSDEMCVHGVVSIGVDDLYTGKDIIIYDVNDHTREHELESGIFDQIISLTTFRSNYNYKASDSCNYNLFFINSGLNTEIDLAIENNPSENICDDNNEIYHVASYGGRPLNIDNHSDEFVLDYHLNCWNGGAFNANIDKYINPEIDVIFIGGDDTFSNETAQLIENAVFNDGKILVIRFWSSRKFSSSLPASHSSYAPYGNQMYVFDDVNPIFDGLPLIYDRISGSSTYNRWNCTPKTGSKVLLRYSNDHDPALLYWKYGNGYVIEWTLESGSYFIPPADIDTIMYKLLKDLL